MKDFAFCAFSRFYSRFTGENSGRPMRKAHNLACFRLCFRVVSVFPCSLRSLCRRRLARLFVARPSACLACRNLSALFFVEAIELLDEGEQAGRNLFAGLRATNSEIVNAVFYDLRALPCKFERGGVVRSGHILSLLAQSVLSDDSLCCATTAGYRIVHYGGETIHLR
jgi:hypothetical protein